VVKRTYANRLQNYVKYDIINNAIIFKLLPLKKFSEAFASEVFIGREIMQYNHCVLGSPERVMRTNGNKRMYNYLKFDGTFLSEEWFIDGGAFSDGFACVKRENGLSNFLKTDGTFLCTEWFAFISRFDEDGVASVRRTNGLWNFLKVDGTFLCEEWFLGTNFFFKGGAMVQRQDGEWYWYTLKPDGIFSEAREDI